jgi:lysophospholipase L1-like esterase
MKKLLAFLFVAGLGLGLFFITRSAPTYTNFPPATGKTWVAFGDSLTAGLGAADGADYPSVLGKLLGWPILNFGTPGATTQDGLGKIPDVLKVDPKVVLLCFGGNDTLNGVPHDQTFQNLSQIIDQFHQAGAFVVLIGIRSASVRDKYAAEFKKLARQKKVLYVPNILSGVLGRPGLMSDYVHPNEQGYAAIADRLERILRPLLPGLTPGAENKGAN